MKQLKNLIGDTAIYGLSSILGRLLNWLLVPLYVVYFKPSEYAIVVELFAFIALFNIIFTLGFETTYFRFSSQQKQTHQNYFDLAISMIFLNCLFLGSILIFFSENLALLLQYEGKGHLIIWCVLILSLDAIAAIPFARLRILRKGKKFVAFKLLNIGLNIGLNLFFIVYLPVQVTHDSHSLLAAIYFPELGAGHIFLSNLIANSIYLLLFSGVLLRVKFNFSVKILKPFLAYAAPLVVLQLAGVINEMFSRQSLKYLLPEGFYPDLSNAAALGIFGACFKLSVFMALSVQAYKFAFEPFFFNHAHETNSKQLYASAMNGFIIFGGLSWMVISLMLPELAQLIFGANSPYLDGLIIVPVLLGSGLVMGIFFNLSVWYKLTDHTRIGAVISVLGAILTILLNVSLIPVLGFMGSAWASIISWLFMTLLSYFIGQRYFPIKYKLSKGCFYFIYATLATAMIVNLDLSLFIRYGLGLGLVGFYLFLVYYVEKSSKKEVEYH
ncbi:MAG: polysaccharide biosynthesis protein [Flammeovirgaceae bacterium]|nr:polysaccharide biosynthesis protein [Flammeovirgaceae bacterium]